MTEEIHPCRERDRKIGSRVGGVLKREGRGGNAYACVSQWDRRRRERIQSASDEGSDGRTQ